MKTTKFTFKTTVFNHEKTQDHRYSMFCWVRDNFGSPGMNKDWFKRTYKTPTNYGINELNEVYYFKNKKDALLFAMKWV